MREWPVMSLRNAGCAGLLGVLTCLAGCAAGPHFTKPAAPKLARYARVPLVATVATPGTPAGAAQHVRRGVGVSAAWWRAFHSPVLNRLETQALAHNPTLAAARAALRAAHEDVLAERGSFYPAVSAGLAAGREHDPAATLAPVPSNNAYLYSLFTPQLGISYTPDLFGLARRARESLKARAQSVRFQSVAAWNTLTTNVALTAIEVASLQGQLTAQRRLVTAQTRGLKLWQLRQQHGDASRLDVSAQRAQWAQARVAQAALAKQLADARNALATLTGRFPSQTPTPPLNLQTWHLPATLPLSLPSQLVAQRPDVRQAQADLHAASAAIGIAAAERLPQLNLSADVGSTSLAISKVFASGTGFWGIAASLTAPLFDGGQLKHQERAAKAAYVEAANTYRGTVLAAFRDVADTLVAIDEDAASLKAAAAADTATRTALKLSRLKRRHAAIGDAQLLAAEQIFQQAHQSLIQAQARRFADTAALYQALGGGWWQRATSTRH